MSQIDDKETPVKFAAGGCLGIVTGIASSVMGLIYILVAANDSDDLAGGFVSIAMVITGLILGVLSIAICSYALARKNLRFGLVGAICAVLATIFSYSILLFFPIVLGIAAIVLILLSRGEFKR